MRIRGKNSSIFQSRQKLVFDSPNGFGANKHASFYTNPEMQVNLNCSNKTPKAMSENLSQNLSEGQYAEVHSNKELSVIADFNNLNFDTLNKLSSTAAFKTISSSPTKLLNSESPKTSFVRVKEEQKTVKRGSGNGKGTPKIPGLVREIDVEIHEGIGDKQRLKNLTNPNQPCLIRKNTKRHMVVLDENYAEPFEIIENTDLVKKLKNISPFKDSGNTQNQVSPIETFDIEKTEKKGQKSSFCESDFFKPKMAATTHRAIKSNQISHKDIIDYSTLRSLKTQHPINNSSLVGQLMKHQSQTKRKGKVNFITTNIRNISKYREKRNLKTSKNSERIQNKRYSQIHSSNSRSRNEKSRESKPSSFNTHSLSSSRQIPKEIQAFNSARSGCSLTKQALKNSGTPHAFQTLPLLPQFSLNMPKNEQSQVKINKIAMECGPNQGARTSKNGNDRYSCEIMIHTTLDESLDSEYELQLR